MLEPKRKLRVAYTLIDDVVGGIQTHTVDLACTLAERGFRVYVIFPESETRALDTFAGVLEASNVSIVYFNLKIGQPLSSLFANLIRLRRWLQTQQIDVFHIQRSISNQGKAAILVACAAGIPVVVSTTHDQPPHLRGGARWINQKVNSLLNTTIVVSECGRQMQLESKDIPANKIDLIYNGIKSDNFAEISPEGRAAALASLQLAPDSLIVGTLARLEPSKGVVDLLAAVSKLKKCWPNLTTLIAGVGSQRAALEQETLRLGLTDHVRFLSYVPDAREFYGLLDIFVLPSYWEAFGLVATEAMAMGKPVVATRVGGLPEVVSDEETGLIVPMGDPSALATAIKRLLDDKHLREQMGAAGRNRVKTVFSITRMADQTIALYRSLLAAKKV